VAESRKAIIELVDSFLESWGLDPTEVKDEDGARPLWAFQSGSAQIEMSLTELTSGEPSLEIWSPLVYVPERNRQALFEYLLRENVHLSDVAFAVEGDQVVIVASRDADEVSPETIKRLVTRLANAADEFDDELSKLFGVKMVGDPADND
jgi:hypothetical protein